MAASGPFASHNYIEGPARRFVPGTVKPSSSAIIAVTRLRLQLPATSGVSRVAEYDPQITQMTTNHNRNVSLGWILVMAPARSFSAVH